jgi:hypothetical protein
MTTPSHHRVHHGRNEKYMDQNYAHIFIFWDRLFGTFKEEKEEPDYGITSGFERANAFNATFSYWRNLIARAKKTNSLKNKINVFTKGPAWTPTDVDHLPNQFKTDHKGNRVPHKIAINNEKRAYILFNILITACSFIALLYLKSKLGKNIGLDDLITNKSIVSLVGIIIISVFAHSRIIENKKFAILTDGIRLGAIISLTIYGFDNSIISSWLIPLVFIYCFIMFLWLIKINIKPNRKPLRA